MWKDTNKTENWMWKNESICEILNTFNLFKNNILLFIDSSPKSWCEPGVGNAGWEEANMNLLVKSACSGWGGWDRQIMKKTSKLMRVRDGCQKQKWNKVMGSGSPCGWAVAVPVFAVTAQSCCRNTKAATGNPYAHFTKYTYTHWDILAMSQ